jgi:hypothetical protein
MHHVYQKDGYGTNIDLDVEGYAVSLARIWEIHPGSKKYGGDLDNRALGGSSDVLGELDHDDCHKYSNTLRRL